MNVANGGYVEPVFYDPNLSTWMTIRSGYITGTVMATFAYHAIMRNQTDIITAWAVTGLLEAP